MLSQRRGVDDVDRSALFRKDRVYSHPQIFSFVSLRNTLERVSHHLHGGGAWSATQKSSDTSTPSRDSLATLAEENHVLLQILAARVTLAVASDDAEHLQSVLQFSSQSSTRLLKQLAEFDGDRLK